MTWARHIRRGATALALAAGIGSVPAAPAYATPAPSWTANDDDRLLFDLRMKQLRLGNGVRGYQTDKGVCVDLADMIMALDLPVRLDKKSRRATGWLFEEGRTITINRDNNTVQIVNKNLPLEGSDLYDTPEGWCVNAGTLARWMNVTISVDMSNALLMLSADRKLPFELAEERKRRAGSVQGPRQFDLRSLPSAKEPYRMWRTPSVDAVVSFTAIRDQHSGNSIAGRYEFYASGEIARASVDARLSSDHHGVPDSLRIRAYRTDPDGALLGPLQATHFAIGDISAPDTALATTSSVGRGITVTNRPVDRPEQFDSTNFRGDLPQGWDAELYRNDQLLGFAGSRSDGRYEFLDIPLLYGQNRFEIVLYGPQGQEKRERVMVPVGLDSIPPRKTYYWAGLQDKGRDLVNLGAYEPPDDRGWRAGFGMERGLDAKTAINASFTSIRFNGRRRNFGEVSLRRAIGPTLAELSAASDLAGGTAVRGKLMGQVGQTWFTAETIHGYGGYASEQLDDDMTSLTRFSIDHQIKFGGNMIPVHVEARHVHYKNGFSSMELAARLSWNMRRMTMTAEVDWTRQKGVAHQSSNERIEASLKASGQIGPVRLRGEARFQIAPASGFQSTNFTAQWRAGERSDWRVETGYDVRASRARLAGGIVRRFERLSLTASAEAASDGSVGIGLNLAFSLGQDPQSGSLRMSADKLASQGQASVVVFHDDNNDGRRQSTESVASDVIIVSGLAAQKVTEKNGFAHVAGLQPFKPVLIGIDAGSLPDPFIQPATSGKVVIPRPGVPMRVELPLVAAGEVQGTLVREGGALLGGVGLELLDTRNQVVSRTMTEFDGYFLFEKIPYGRYRVRIASLSAAAIGAVPMLDGEVTVGQDNPAPNIGIKTAHAPNRVAGGS